VATGSTSTRDDRKNVRKAQKSPLEAAGEYLDPGIQRLHLRTASEDQKGRTLDTVRTKEYETREKRCREPRARFLTTFTKAKPTAPCSIEAARSK
jgi:hypothetical protein